jgi:hypothetical protein
MSKDKNKLQDIFGSKAPAEEVQETPKPKEKPKKPPRKQIRNKGQYDLPREMIDEIKSISAEWKAPASGIVELLIKLSLDSYRRGEIDIEPHLTTTRSLKYLYGIDSDYELK